MGIFKVLEEECKNSESFKKECDAEATAFEIGVFLKNLRKEKGLTQEDVAKSSGLTINMISRLETYASSPTLGTLIRYCNALGYNFLEVLEKGFKDN